MGTNTGCTGILVLDLHTAKPSLPFFYIIHRWLLMTLASMKYPHLKSHRVYWQSCRALNIAYIILILKIDCNCSHGKAAGYQETHIWIMLSITFTASFKMKVVIRTDCNLKVVAVHGNQSAVVMRFYSSILIHSEAIFHLIQRNFNVPSHRTTISLSVFLT